MADVLAAPLEILACPFCGAGLTHRDSIVACSGCGQNYRVTAAGQVDLRLPRPRKTTVEFELGGNTDGSADSPPQDFGFLRPNPDPQLLYNTIPIPPLLLDGNRLTPELLSYFPKAQPGKKGYMLDLGCGGQPFREICRHTNFEYVGMDYDGDLPMLLGDAHALPFPDQTFDFIVSFAVWEHLHNPFVAAKEAFRVLKPGGIFIGTVAFLEPFHLRSYFHHTHLGTYHVLQSAGLSVKVVAPNIVWNSLRAQSRMALFPHAPEPFTRLAVFPVYLMHRLWWWLGHKVRKDMQTSNHQRVLTTTGGYRFVAVKPSNPATGRT